MTRHGSPEPRVTGKWRPWPLEGRGGKVLTDWFMPWFRKIFSCGSVVLGILQRPVFEQTLSHRLLAPALKSKCLGVIQI